MTLEDVNELLSTLWRMQKKMTEWIMLKEYVSVEGVTEAEDHSSRISTRNLEGLYIRTER